MRPNATECVDTPAKDMIECIARNNDVLLFGDTLHRDGGVKSAAFSHLEELREQGFSTLWLEFDATEKRQRGLDTLMRIENLTEDQVRDWVPAKQNKEVFADAIMRARDVGMEIGLLMIKLH